MLPTRPFRVLGALWTYCAFPEIVSFTPRGSGVMPTPSLGSRPPRFW
jgi:hypothetical protein